MMRGLAPLIMTLFLLSAAAPATAQSAGERAQLDWVWERGRLLYELDRAAWVGTDDLLERLPDASSAGIRGYVVERDGPNHVVTFFGGPPDAPVAFYRGRVENERVVAGEVFAADARPPLSPLQRRLAAVRGMAGELKRRPCEDAPFNTVVIPPAAPDDPVDLYLLTPQLRDGEWPAGGHFRATVAADGTVSSSRAFTNSCINVGGGEVGRDQRPAGLVITHLLDPIPTEIHVFTMWTSRLPLAVGTSSPHRIWLLSSEGIELDDSSGRD
jgi:hypothetical protein